MTDSFLPADEAPATPEAPAVAEPATPPPAALERFSFTGDAREYFRIWIVNLFLTVVTLGIYSAWAKVRKKRYFYGNTWVAGSNFDYHGDPVAILKGRIIAFGAFAGYSVAEQFSPRIASWIFLALLPFVPWLIVRSLAFNAVNSSYRNLRFRFTGRYLEALAAIAPFVLIPVASLVLPAWDEVDFSKPSDIWPLYIPLLLFALAYPYVVGALKRLHVARSAFGDTPFACAVRIGAFYRIYALAFLLTVVLFMLFSVSMGAFLFLPRFGWVVMSAIYVALVAVLFAYVQARVANEVFNATRLGAGGRFASTLSARRLARLYVENLLAIAATLGLAIPWAAVRTARYRAECVELQCTEGLDSFVARASRRVGATGEAMGEMFDVDFSL